MNTKTYPNLFTKRYSVSFCRNMLVSRLRNIRSHPIVKKIILDENFKSASVVLAYVFLLYKQVALGVVFLAILGSYLVVKEKCYVNLQNKSASFATLYIILATISAFIVSIDGGISKAIQFLICFVGAMGAVSCIFSMPKTQKYNLLKCFIITNVFIIFHIIIFHVSIGNYVTWKYLADTKFVFSMISVLTFAFEDKIRNKSSVAWFTCLAVVALCIVLSGERKAYLLFAVLFCFSRTKLTTKTSMAIIGGVMLLSFITFQPDSYVTRQLSSGGRDPSTLSNRAFFAMENVGSQSDYIRTFVNRNARRIFKENPIFGIGATGYQQWAFKRYGSVEESRGLSINVHGEPNRVPAESGAVGILVAITFLCSVTWRILRYTISQGGINAPSLSRFPLYLLIFMCSYLYSEAMDTTMMMFILCMGFMASSLKYEPLEVRITT